MMKLLSRLNKWNMAEWINVVNSNDFLIPLHEHYNSKSKVYDSALLKVDDIIYGGIAWNSETNDCSIEVELKYLPKVYKALENIAIDLGGKFYITKNEVFDSKKHLPIPVVKLDRGQQFFENHDLDYVRWIAFREENKASIFKSLELGESKEVYLKDGIDSNKFIVTPSFSGWTFIIGDDLPDLLIKGGESSTEKALTNLCNSLKKLSKKFIEVQYFEYHGKSNITGYFKANNGKLKFGYWKSETEDFIKGKVPKEIKSHHPASAHEVASIWSIDPLDFIYIEKFAMENSTLAIPLNTL